MLESESPALSLLKKKSIEENYSQEGCFFSTFCELGLIELLSFGGASNGMCAAVSEKEVMVEEEV